MLFLTLINLTQNILIFDETFFHLFELVLHIYFSLGYFICISKLDKLLNKYKEQKDKKDFYFFDESRFGTHSNTGLAWYKKDKRTDVKVKLGRENFYLYGSVNSHSGDDFYLDLPYVNTDRFNLYLREFSKHVGEKKVILIMDGASWHKSKYLKIPKNIEFMILPAYSPELNPIERLWKYIKDNTIKNNFFLNIDLLREKIGKFIVEKLNCSIIKSIYKYRYFSN